jgi:basic amino acid/polyamine antiporter, APA family
VTVLLGFAAPVAASASASASYLLKPLNLPDRDATLATQGLASVAILIFVIIHTMGRSQSAKVQVSITLLKLGTLLVFLVAGLAVGWPHVGNLNDRPPINGTSVSNMLFSLVYIAYGYFGWNAASYLAGEVRDPGRTLPRAIGLGTGLVILLYLGLNTVYAMALPAAEIQQIAATKGKGAIAPIAELAAERLFGSQWASVLSVTVGLMLLSTLSAYILTGPRVAFAMARARQFPAVAGRLSNRFQTPAVATAVLASLSLILLWTGSFNSIVIYASVGMSLFSILTIGAVYVLRWRRPDLHRPFRTPGYPVVPAIYMIVSAALTVATAINSPRVTLYSALSMVAGIPIYYLWQLTLGRKPPGPIEADSRVSV